jgi:hypothetical protein
MDLQTLDSNFTFVFLYYLQQSVLTLLLDCSTVHADHKEVNEMMEELGKKLYLAKHLAGINSRECKELYTPTDIGTFFNLMNYLQKKRKRKNVLKELISRGSRGNRWSSLYYWYIFHFHLWIENLTHKY